MERTTEAKQVRYKLSDRELLEALAEECTEAAQAALKLIRAKGYSNNVTPVSPTVANASLKEELIDVCMVALSLGILPTEQQIKECPKWQRWLNRLNKI